MKFLILLLGSALLASANEINNISTEKEDNASVKEAKNERPEVSTKPPTVPAGMPNLQPIMRAIEVFEFISKFSNSDQDGFGVAKVHSTSMTFDDNANDSTNARNPEKSSSTGNGLVRTSDPVTMFLSVMVYGASKLSALILTWFMYLSASIMPGSVDGDFRYQDNFYHLDYNTISDSIRQLPVKGFNLFDIREEECQSRAMCEI